MPRQIRECQFNTAVQGKAETDPGRYISPGRGDRLHSGFLDQKNDFQSPVTSYFKKKSMFRLVTQCLNSRPISFAYFLLFLVDISLIVSFFLFLYTFIVLFFCY